MFFKNAYIFAFTQSFNTSELELNAAMHEHSFTPLGSTEMSHYGWTSSLGKGSDLTTESNGNILICARKEEKILPAPVIKEMVAERVEQLEAEQGRSATKKEREQFKEDVIFELLPRAFNRITDTYGYINAKENIIVIDSASRGKAEDFLALLRKTLGTLPVTSVSPEVDPSEVMTDWLNGNLARQQVFITNNFAFGEDAEFQALGDNGAVAKVKDQDLNSPEVMAHLQSGKYATKLALDYDDSISFMLHDDLSIKRIKFADVIAEQNDDYGSDDVQGKLIADFTLMAGELNLIINSLHGEFNIKATDYLEA
tara:strand:+ start:39518 stop:40453 length:936 start_codon:yes stop_codon:yes gene_type:complete